MLARGKEGKLEILLLKRNKALVFAGGLWVFPGGKIEKSEIEQTENELEAARLAAVRETKEETNVDVNPQDLIFFRHWTTPENEPRRYATYFFFGEVNGYSKVEIDDSEIKDHVWLHPQAALDRLSEGNLAMLPPTIMTLQLIRKCNSVKEIRTKLSNEEPIFVLPVLDAVTGKMVCIYEGDVSYETGNSKIEGARHRLTIDMKTGNFDFEYEGCDHITPVNGGMHL